MAGGGSDGAECIPAKKRRVEVVTLATTAGGVAGTDEKGFWELGTGSGGGPSIGVPRAGVYETARRLLSRRVPGGGTTERTVVA